VNIKFNFPNFWVYILQCQNQSFYTGYTHDLFARYRAHIEGTAAKYTRAFRPVEVVGVWPVYGDKSMAMKIERFIKTLSKKEKRMIIDHPFVLRDMFMLNV
jgi:putative endonuclease